MEKELVWRIDEDTGCYNCISHKPGAHGYINITRNKRSILAHRYMYEKYREKIPHGIFVLHKCDNRICINPDHLWLGSQSDNILDMHKKRRHSGLKLTEEKVITIRAMYSTGKYTQKELGELFDTDRSNISLIILRKAWRWC